MYERILVALDGSDLAEHILPHVEALGQALGATLVLLRAAASSELVAAGLTAGEAFPPADFVDPSSVTAAGYAEVDGYLATVAERLRGRGLRVQTARAEGDAADAILRLADEVDADLIAMTTHGRTGLRRLVVGSVAGAVLRRSTRPLFVVRVVGDDDRGKDTS
jgi:nucleotide-binding universal stress UspA family protein